MTTFDEPDVDLSLPFVFVPNGAPDPVEWRARHPGWVAIPAKMFLPARAPGGAAETIPVRDLVPTARGTPSSPSVQGRECAVGLGVGDDWVWAALVGVAASIGCGVLEPDRYSDGVGEGYGGAGGASAPR